MQIDELAPDESARFGEFACENASTYRGNEAAALIPIGPVGFERRNWRSIGPQQGVARAAWRTIEIDGAVAREDEIATRLAPLGEAGGFVRHGYGFPALRKRGHAFGRFGSVVMDAQITGWMVWMMLERRVAVQQNRLAINEDPAPTPSPTPGPKRERGEVGRRLTAVQVSRYEPRRQNCAAK